MFNDSETISWYIALETPKRSTVKKLTYIVSKVVYHLNLNKVYIIIHTALKKILVFENIAFVDRL